MKNTKLKKVIWLEPTWIEMFWKILDSTSQPSFVPSERADSEIKLILNSK